MDELQKEVDLLREKIALLERLKELQEPQPVCVPWYPVPYPYPQAPSYTWSTGACVCGWGDVLVYD